MATLQPRSWLQRPQNDVDCLLLVCGSIALGKDSSPLQPQERTAASDKEISVARLRNWSQRITFVNPKIRTIPGGAQIEEVANRAVGTDWPPPWVGPPDAGQDQQV